VLENLIATTGKGMLYYFVLLKPGMWRWKRLNFCGSGSTLKKEAKSGSNSEAFDFLRSRKLKHFS